MRVFISVVSHGHGELISKLDVLSRLNEKFEVIIKNNVEDSILKKYACENNIKFIDSEYNLGFGENNNKVYDCFIDSYEVRSTDIFIVLNPDVYIDFGTINNLVSQMKSNNANIAGINLYTDYEYKTYDYSVRKFPGFFDFTLSILGFGNKTIIDKSSLPSATNVDWVAGSFIAFNIAHYGRLGGFDTRYFMYCEDIDICFRSNVAGEPVVYFPEIKAIHLAQHANRSLFSKHFNWHIKSAFRFLLKKYSIIRN